MKKKFKTIIYISICFFLIIFINYKSNYGFIIKNNKNNLVSYVIFKKKFNNYIESLPTCYNESYYYDKNKNITITNIKTQKFIIFNKITLKYKKNNICKNEFTLEEYFIKEFIDNAKIEEITFGACSKKQKTLKYNITNLLKEIEKEEYIKENKNISIPEKCSILINIYYTLNEIPYVLNIFKTEDFIIFKNVDINDHPKIIKYKLNQNIIDEINNLK